MIAVETKNGSHLTESDLETINYWRTQEFHSTTLWNKQSCEAFYDSTFFLIKVNSVIVSFGRLRPIVIYIETKPRAIFGIATIVSVTKRKGYGKRLMEEMKEYIRKSKKTAIGFCGKINTEFYRKCGFQIIEDGQKYFAYVDEQGEKHYEEGDVFYIKGNDDIVQYLLTSKNSQIIHKIPHW